MTKKSQERQKKNLERIHNLVHICEANFNVHNIIRNFDKVDGIIFHQSQTGEVAFIHFSSWLLLPGTGTKFAPTCDL